MKNYLGEFPVDIHVVHEHVNANGDVIAKYPMSTTQWALYFIERYGGIDGDHHKTWVIDQVARILNGAPVTVVEARWGDDSGAIILREHRATVGSSPEYVKWVVDMKSGEDGPDTYSWDEGIAP